ncbi:MAG: ABC transporter permease [Candidatus Dormibacteria bacterium]
MTSRGGFGVEVSAVFALAYRDFLKFMRDPARIVSSFIFPVIFIGVLGGSLQANLGRRSGYDLLTFVFTGIFMQTMFQSTASGLISLVEDRQADFSQEMFISPISRYTILVGKIIGETLVALPQGLAVLVFGLVIGIHFGLAQVIAIIPAGLAAAIFGGAFGVAVMANLTSQRSAQQIFPFLIFPQFFLGGAFTPIRHLPLPLDLLSRITPMRYAIDFGRGIFYIGRSDYDTVVLHSPLYNLVVMGVMFVLFLGAGTFLFVRGERNR